MTETDSDDADETTDEQDDSLTTQTGLIWKGLPTLVAGTSLASFIALVVGATTPLPVDLSAVPQAWALLYMALVFGAGATTIGADAMSTWMDIRGDDT